MQPAKPATAMDVQIIQVSARFNQTFQTIKKKYFFACFPYNIVNEFFCFKEAFESKKMEIWSTYSVNVLNDTALNWGTVFAVDTSGDVTIDNKDMEFLVSAGSLWV